MLGTAPRVQPDALVSCLLLCLDDAERRSTRSGQLIRAALQILELRALSDQVPPYPGFRDGQVIASYLTYLLPELEARSVDAATLVRQAAGLLQRQGGGGGMRLVH